MKSLMRSKTGYALSLLHMLAVIYLFSQKQPLSYAEAEHNSELAGQGWTVGQVIAGRYYHLPDEHPILEAIGMIDGPALVASIAGLVVLTVHHEAVGLQPSTIELSWAWACILLLTTSLQWLLMGYWAESVVGGMIALLRRKWNNAT